MQMGQKFRMVRIEQTKVESEAYKLERHYIKKYRRMGYVLMNCTYGGPDEIPMKINNMKNPNQKGILLPAKKKLKKVVVKKKKKKPITIKKKAKEVDKKRGK